MAQLGKGLNLAQVMMSQLMDSSPALGSVLTAQSLEPASDSVSPSLSLSALLLLTLCLSLSLKNNINKNKKKSSNKNPLLPYTFWTKSR